MNHLNITAPGVAFTRRVTPVTGDRLIHPRDVENDLARIVLRWGRAWLPETWAAHEHFAALSGQDEEGPHYRDEHVAGWLLLQPRPGSLAAQVRSGVIDVATALAAEAEAWPSEE